MKAAIFVLALFALIMCTSRVEPPAQAADIFKDLKGKIFDCILKKTTTATLIQFVKDHSKEDFHPSAFRALNLTREDRKLIKECKREALRPKKTESK